MTLGFVLLSLCQPLCLKLVDPFDCLILRGTPPSFLTRSVTSTASRSTRTYAPKTVRHFPSFKMAANCRSVTLAGLFALLTVAPTDAFSTASPASFKTHRVCPNKSNGLAAAAAEEDTGACNERSAITRRDVVATSALAAALAFGVATGAAPAWADEFGRETEAPTLFTGENVMVSSIEHNTSEVQTFAAHAIPTCVFRMLAAN